MMLAAITALLSLPLVTSHRFNKSLITVTRNMFSWSSAIDPEIEPTAQQSVLRPDHDQSFLAASCARSASCIWRSVSSWSRWAR